MNRKQRRTLEKKVKKSGVSDKDAKAYVDIVNNLDAIRTGGAGEPTQPKKFEEGDKVVINLQRVRARKNYDRMLDAYKEFVNSSEGVVFTVHIEKGNLISFIENPRWLFWSGDLDKAPLGDSADE